MAGVVIRGGSALRARLKNMANLPPEFTGVWAETAAQRIRETKPPSTRPASSRFTTKATARRGGVYGAFWWIFIDRGTKAHDITPRKAKALRFEKGGETIFARKVHRKRMRRRPFISKAAQGALADLGSDLIVQSWNGRRIKGKSHRRFL